MAAAPASGRPTRPSQPGQPRRPPSAPPRRGRRSGRPGGLARPRLHPSSGASRAATLAAASAVASRSRIRARVRRARTSVRVWAISWRAAHTASARRYGSPGDQGIGERSVLVAQGDQHDRSPCRSAPPDAPGWPEATSWRRAGPEAPPSLPAPSAPGARRPDRLDRPRPGGAGGSANGGVAPAELADRRRQRCRRPCAGRW